MGLPFSGSDSDQDYIVSVGLVHFNGFNTADLAYCVIMVR